MKRERCICSLLACALLLASHTSAYGAGRRRPQVRGVKFTVASNLPEYRFFNPDLDAMTYPSKTITQVPMPTSNYKVRLLLLKGSQDAKATEGRFFGHKRQTTPTFIILPLNTGLATGVGTGYGFGFPFNFTNINNNTLNAAAPAAAAAGAAGLRLAEQPANSGNVHLIYNSPAQTLPAPLSQQYHNPHKFAAPQLAYSSQEDDTLFVVPQQPQHQLTYGSGLDVDGTVYATKSNFRNNLRNQLLQFANRIQYI